MTIVSRRSQPKGWEKALDGAEKDGTSKMPLKVADLLREAWVKG
jgi:hypothetical protein